MGGNSDNETDAVVEYLESANNDIKNSENENKSIENSNNNTNKLYNTQDNDIKTSNLNTDSSSSSEVNKNEGEFTPIILSNELYRTLFYNKNLLDINKREPSTTSDKELIEILMNKIALSPTLSEFYDELKDQGWKFFYYGAPGGGSYCNRYAQHIVIDEMDKFNSDWVFSALIHEIGHAIYVPESINPEHYTEDEYVAKGIEIDTKDEGEANIFTYEILEEIFKNDIENVEVIGVEQSIFMKAYNKYLIDFNRDSLREEIGKHWMAFEPSGSPPNSTYKEVYSKYWRDEYKEYWKKKLNII